MGFQDDHINSYRIHLGSRSPRREQLLRGLGLDFEIWIKEESEENYPDGLGPAEVALYLARSKADLYLSDLVDRDILLTADTIVAIDDEILHKPDSRAHAISSLKKLMGREHIVITGTCLSSNDKCSCFCSETVVKFASLDDAEIDYYVDKFAPFDKAGAYGIQEWIGYIGVESIQGSYFNVMGLPVQRLYSELKAFTGYKK